MVQCTKQAAVVGVKWDLFYTCTASVGVILHLFVMNRSAIQAALMSETAVGKNG